MWPRIRYPFQPDSARYARTYRSTRLFRFGLSATFFLHTKKEDKDVSGGIAPWTPSGLPAFFRGKPAVARLPESTIKKGCRPEGLGGHNFMHFI